MPPTRRLDAENGSNMRSRSSAAIGSPELCDGDADRVLRQRRAEHLDVDHAAGRREPDRIGDQVAEHLRQPLGIAEDRDVVGRRAEHDGQVLRRSGGAVAIDHLAREAVELHRGRGHGDRARLRAREVEELIDELVHARRGLARHVDVAELAVRERRLRSRTARCRARPRSTSAACAARATSPARTRARRRATSAVSPRSRSTTIAPIVSPFSRSGVTTECSTRSPMRTSSRIGWPSLAPAASSNG